MWIEKIMSGYNSFKFANWPKSLESHSLMQINYPKINCLASFLGGENIILAYFGDFWQSTKIKITKYKSSFVDFIDKHVIFGDYIFIYLKSVSMIKNDNCYMHNSVQIKMYIYSKSISNYCK